MIKRTKRPAWLGTGKKIARDKANKVSTFATCNQVEEFGLYPTSHEDPQKSSHNQTADFILERTLWVQHRE